MPHRPERGAHRRRPKYRICRRSSAPASADTLDRLSTARGPAHPRVPAPPLNGIEQRLAAQLAAPDRAWLHQALADAAEAPQGATWELHFASAGRRCGRAAATDVRVLLLHAAGAGIRTVIRLYHQGTAAERQAVLAALPYLDLDAEPGPDTGAEVADPSIPGVRADAALALVEDALRADDTTLVAAAVGPYAAARLPAHAWRHAVLKCLHTGVPLDAVAGYAERARGDAELLRMLGDHARECTAAGRLIPADLRRAMESADPPAEGG